MSEWIKQIKESKNDFGSHLIVMSGGCAILGVTFFGAPGAIIGAIIGLVFGIMTKEK